MTIKTTIVSKVIDFVIRCDTMYYQLRETISSYHEDIVEEPYTLVRECVG
jgi:hypothetical protein